jgi:hypothetical protein
VVSEPRASRTVGMWPLSGGAMCPAVAGGRPRFGCGQGHPHRQAGEDAFRRWFCGSGPHPVESVACARSGQLPHSPRCRGRPPPPGPARPGRPAQQTARAMSDRLACILDTAAITVWRASGPPRSSCGPYRSVASRRSYQSLAALVPHQARRRTPAEYEATANPARPGDLYRDGRRWRPVCARSERRNASVGLDEAFGSKRRTTDAVAGGGAPVLRAVVCGGRRHLLVWSASRLWP